jgi:hypothetical protein
MLIAPAGDGITGTRLTARMLQPVRSVDAKPAARQ